MKVQVDGLAPFINRLEKFDKDVSKELKAEMRAAGSSAVLAAQGLYFDNALTNWGGWQGTSKSGDIRNLSFNAAVARRSVKIVTNRYRRRGVTTSFGYSLMQMNAGAAILEFAGSKTSNAFTRAIEDNWGKATVVPRVLGLAYYQTAPEVRAKMEAAVQAAMRKVGL